MTRWLLPVAVLAVCGLIVSVVGLAHYAGKLGGDPRAALAQPKELEGLAIPEFSLVDQDGKPVTQAILDGRVTVLDFTFTHCPFACPMMNASMIELAGELDKTPVRFLSISVDPEHDTPGVLKKHADELGVDQARWRFLTGDKGAVARIAQGALMFPLQSDTSRTIDLPDGSKMQNIMHPTKFMLIGPDRKVLGIYDYNRDADMRDLALRARAALVAMGTG